MALGDVFLPSFLLDGLLSQTWQDEDAREEGTGSRTAQSSLLIGPHTVLSLSFVP